MHVLEHHHSLQREDQETDSNWNLENIWKMSWINTCLTFSVLVKLKKWKSHSLRCFYQTVFLPKSLRRTWDAFSFEFFSGVSLENIFLIPSEFPSIYIIKYSFRNLFLNFCPNIGANFSENLFLIFFCINLANSSEIVTFAFFLVFLWQLLRHFFCNSSGISFENFLGN